ncbi:hypothetical protein GCM10022415_15960 [Knoellia locipacati]|uniref:Uncharacterized protein n=1 Tax=Knoellia locipacati TaxID=882824 RepID=A0A512SZZ0_9MICO|nr:hypothetical protein KLO01_15930 [Knoellia locipacati]
MGLGSIPQNVAVNKGSGPPPTECAYCHGSVDEPLWHHMELGREDPTSPDPWPADFLSLSFCCEQHLSDYFRQGLSPPPDFRPDEPLPAHTVRDRLQEAAVFGGLGLAVALAVVGLATVIRWLT